MGLGDADRQMAEALPLQFIEPRLNGRGVGDIVGAIKLFRDNAVLLGKRQIIRIKRLEVRRRRLDRANNRSRQIRLVISCGGR